MAGAMGSRGNGQQQRGSADRPTAIVKPGEAALSPQKQVERLFLQAAQRLDKMVPSHLKAERLWRLSIAAMARDAKLCEATPQSILLATLQCASLGLEPSTALQQAYLVPFNNNKRYKDGGGVWRDNWVSEAQLVIGYRGYILLAEQAAVVSSVVAHVVHYKDEYIPTLEGGEFRHTPYQDGDPGPMRAAYCRWISSAGKREYWPLSLYELERHRDKHAKKDYKSAAVKANQPWVTDFEAMCRKTTVRQASAFWPMMSERAEKLRAAIALDERADAGAPDYRIGLTEDMQSAMHDMPELRDSLEYEPDPDYVPPGNEDEEPAELQGATAAPVPEAAAPRRAAPARPNARGEGALTPEEEKRAFSGTSSREPGSDG